MLKKKKKKKKKLCMRYGWAVLHEFGKKDRNNWSTCSLRRVPHGCLLRNAGVLTDSPPFLAPPLSSRSGDWWVFVDQRLESCAHPGLFGERLRLFQGEGLKLQKPAGTSISLVGKKSEEVGVCERNGYPVC